MYIYTLHKFGFKVLVLLAIFPGCGLCIRPRDLVTIILHVFDYRYTHQVQFSVLTSLIIIVSFKGLTLWYHVVS